MDSRENVNTTTAFDARLLRMSSGIHRILKSDFHLFSEIFCNTEDLVHATLSDACSLKAGEECNSFVCDSDYERNTNAEVLSCTASGSWSHNLSTICICKRIRNLQRPILFLKLYLAILNVICI